jgi:hypothetical protein
MVWPVGGIFINYRGEDSQTAAALIDHELVNRFGNDQVFLDSRSIPAGVDFVEELLGRLRACSVLLVVIGPRWLTLTDQTGRRLIENPQDWIRREIVEAFTHNLRVIPVLTDGATLPRETDLPADIAALSRRQYVPLRRRYSAVDLAYLVKQITRTDPKLMRSRHRIMVGVAAILLILVVGIFVVKFDDARSLVGRALGKSTEPSSAPTIMHVEVPGGGGFAEVDTVRRNLTVCDTDANGRGIGADYTVNDGSGIIYHVGDGNGSQPECGHAQVDNARIVSIKVCETDSPTRGDPECTDWQKVP